MAVGVFRKISDKLQTLLTSIKDLLPGIASAAQTLGPAISTFAPSVGGAITLGGAALNKLVDAPQPKPSFQDEFNAGDSNGFIKFRNTI